ncbi:MAG: ATP-binding protein [Mesorhizobium sp.]
MSAVGIRHVSLPDMVKSLVADFRKTAPDTVFSLKLGWLEQSFDDATKTTIRRCLQESITNALRHGRAKSIEIEVSGVANVADPNGSVLLLTVRDDGRGISSAAPFGLGLTGMTERVNALGGTIPNYPRKQGGTEIEISLPFVAAEKPRRAKSEAVTR